ncbi:colicin V production CvpA [Candidatus Endobugula sertula]|uniref:Colicin V production CvpA n=1 Tax=Candidatus Endobugula sertula TaxID=62101 RepID=A0A1D2QQV4_9GAMM|nr:colicin V production CvpA [Candidatus Endobugula sertula]
MNWADWVIILVLVVSGLISLKRGFVKEALSLVVWIAAFVIATWFSPALAPHLEAYASTPSSQQMAAFATLFVVSLLLGSGINYLLASLVRVAGLSNADRGLGVIFGLARGCLMVIAMVLYVPMIVPLDQDDWWQESSLIPYFLGMEENFHQLTTTISDLFVQLI